MNVALWIVQGILATAFFVLGAFQLIIPAEDLAVHVAWAGDAPAWLVRLAGMAEILGAAGLILPWWLDTKRVLTPWASTALGLVMLLATALHGSRGEIWGMLLNMSLFGMAAFVAWGRFRDHLTASPAQKRLVTRSRRIYT